MRKQPGAEAKSLEVGTSDQAPQNEVNKHKGSRSPTKISHASHRSNPYAVGPSPTRGRARRQHASDVMQQQHGYGERLPSADCCFQHEPVGSFRRTVDDTIIAAGLLRQLKEAEVSRFRDAARLQREADPCKLIKTFLRTSG